jgi:hypothetical protein
VLKKLKGTNRKIQDIKHWENLAVNITPDEHKLLFQSFYQNVTNIAHNIAHKCITNGIKLNVDHNSGSQDSCIITTNS